MLNDKAIPITNYVYYGNNGVFSWAFLVNWLLVLILTLTFIFYINRAFAFVVTCMLDWVLWRHAHIKINIESMRISLLGGRIFFKNLSIIEKDFTVSLVQGMITWRYWLLDVRHSQFEEEMRKVGGEALKRNWKLPCRIFLDCVGMEIFVYNRTQAYDNIIASFSKEERVKFEKFMEKGQFDEELKSDLGSSSCGANGSNSGDSSTDEHKTDDTGGMTSDTNDTSDTKESNDRDDSCTRQNNNDRIFDKDRSSEGLPRFVSFLPIEMRMRKFALIVGNRYTPSILVSSATSGTGVFDFARPNEKLDLYKVKFMLNLKDFSVALKQNVAYNEDVTIRFKHRRSKISRLWRRTLRMLKIIIVPLGLASGKKKKAGNDIFYRKWMGLSLYKGTMFDDIKNNLNDVEFDLLNYQYAKVTNIMKASKFIASYEYDVPGIVPHGALPTVSPNNGPDVGNSGAAPAMNLNIQIYGGSITYGPWAHNQIMHFQSLLSPYVSKSAIPQKRLTPGSTRIYTIHKVGITVMDDITFRVPTREPSKDAGFLKRYRETNDEFRSFGWLDLKFTKDSTINAIMSLCPSESGFKNEIAIHLVDNEIRSSVNHDLFMKCKNFDFNIDMEYPLGWNEKATWGINLNTSDLEAFLLREHITLIADILSDFSSGQPTPYELFRPLMYYFAWKINGYSIHLNVNDHNIVNDPLDFNENCYLSFHGDELTINATIPKESITGNPTNIVYDIFTPNFFLVLNTPPWNKVNEFVTYKEVGRSYDFRIEGSCVLYSDLDIENVDEIVCRCTSRSTALMCYGFVIRYLINVKMNYFGDFFHFVTSEEYTSAIATGNTVNNTSQSVKDATVYSLADNDEETVAGKANPDGKTITPTDVKRTSNESDLWFVFNVVEGALIIPQMTYNSDPCTVLHFSELDVDLRSCNYYMDILASLNNISLKHYISKKPDDIYGYVRKNNGADFKSHGSLTDLTICGHRMYGLPPTEPTYFCKWDIDIGILNIDSNLSFVKGFFGSFSKLGFGYDDLENVLLYEKEAIDDMTSLTINFKKIDIIMNCEEPKSYLNFSLNDLVFTSIDFENDRYTSRKDITIPRIEARLLGINDTGQETCYFNFRTSLRYTTFKRDKDLYNHRNVQQEFISLNDAPFHRASFLLSDSLQNSFLYNDLYGSIVPSSSLPLLPLPILPATVDYIIEDLLGSYTSLLESPVVFREPFTPNPDNESTIGHSTMLYSDRRDVELIDPLTKTETIDFEALVDTDCSNNIISVGRIFVEINPSISPYLQGLLRDFFAENIMEIIDSTEIDIVNRLGNSHEGATSLVNTKVSISYVNVFWGTAGSGGIEVYLDALDLSFSNKTIEVNRKKNPLDSVFLIKSKSVRVSISDSFFPGSKEERPPALAVVIEGIEAWSSSTDKEVDSVSIVSTDITLDTVQEDWLAQFFADQFNCINEFTKVVTEARKKSQTFRRDLIAKLTVASNFYQINYDPYVITKPALVMRLSKGHMRENRSWKIVTRLRHILVYLPENWYKRVSDAVQDGKLGPTHDSKDIFLYGFSKWRNWESIDAEKSYIFNKLFLSSGFEIADTSKSRIVKSSLSSFLLTAYGTNYEIEHNFVATGTEFLFEHTPPSVELGFSREKIINVTGRLGEIRGKFSDKVMKFRDLVPSSESQKESSSLKQVTTIFSSFKINVALLFHSSNIQFTVDQTTLINKISQGKVSLLWENPKEYTSQEGSLILFAEKSNLILDHKGAVLSELQIRDFSLSATADTWAHQLAVLINLNCSDLQLSAMSPTEVLVRSVRDIEVTVSKQREKLLKRNPRTHSSPFNPTDGIKVEVSCFFNNISMEVVPISPFQFKNEIKQFKIVYNGYGSKAIVFHVMDMDLFLSSNLTKQQYSRISLGDLQVKYDLTKDINKVINVDSSASITKFTLSEPHRIISSFLQDERIAAQSYAQFKSLKIFSHISNSSPSISTPEGRSYAFNGNIKYFGLLVPIVNTFFIAELHSLFFTTSAMKVNDGSEKNESSSYISIDNILFLIKDRMIPSGLSKLIDLSLKVSTSQRRGDPNRSFLIESNHFRVCAGPYPLVRLLWGYHELYNISQYYLRHRIKNLWNFVNTKTKTEEDGGGGFSLGPASFNILSYNFCVGWIFQNKNVEVPGVIIGFKRLFSAFEDNFGKLTLVDAFISVANGETSGTFFSHGDEKEKYIRSYLPNMQISYWVKISQDLMKDISIRFHGEVLDVNLLTFFVGILESFMESIQLFQELKRRFIREVAGVRSSSTQSTLVSNSKSLAPIFSHIRSINCHFRYDGGVFKVFSTEDVRSHSEPSFEIRSPKVQIFMDYKHKLGGIKRHWIRVLTTIDTTHNILSSRCAPLIAEFVDHVQVIMQRHNEANRVDKLLAPSPLPIPNELNTPNVNYAKLLESFDIAFQVKSSKQKLSLSCEPRAKVQADIGFGAFSFNISTNDLDVTRPVSVELIIEKTEASIKHMFSRETSSLFGLDLIDITAMVTQQGKLNIYSTCLVSDLEVYFNVKQIQNLYLFLDLWKFTDMFKSRPLDELERKGSHLSISASNVPSLAIPWSLILIVTNISGNVDFGPSLGVVSVKLERLWAATDHYDDKRQLAHLFLSDIYIQSKGRLSGVLELDGASGVVEINWVHTENVPQHPLVSLSSSITHISIKAAFDYHMFLIGSIFNTKFHLHSEMDVNDILPDLLKVTFSCEKINIYSTALIAANIVDLYNTIMRMRQDSLVSYLETLRESEPAEVAPPLTYKDILSSLYLLQTDVSVSISVLKIQISPISLYDLEVLVINVKDITAGAATHSGKKLETDLKLRVCDVSASLSTSKKEMDEETVSRISVADYIAYTSAIKGGTIIEIPELFIAMTTWQGEDSNTLEFIYNCMFGKKISVRWNLGPVNFIKEMWTTHVRAMAVRQTQSNKSSEQQVDAKSEEKIGLEEITPKFTYVPLREPQIEMPQIRDLGDATPPLDWFGVNRRRLPAFTHQVFIIPVQNLVHVAEKQYANIMGHT